MKNRLKSKSPDTSFNETNLNTSLGSVFMPSLLEESQKITPHAFWSTGMRNKME